MANNKGVIVVFAIIALAAAGLSGYMFTADLLSRNEVVEYSNLKVVAIWDSLEKNIVDNPYHNNSYDFLVEFSNPFILDETYVTVISGTRFSLPNSGMYKITLNMLWSGLDDDTTYWIKLLRNNTQYQYFDYFTTANPSVSQYKYTFSSVFVNSTGGDEYYEINPFTTFLAFGIYENEYYNYLLIEYVIQ